MTSQRHAGRRGRRWARLSTNQKAKRLPCYRCGQPIDYRLKWPDPDCYVTGHIISKKRRPDLAEEPSNLCSEHNHCNREHAERDATPEHNGQPSENW